MGVSVPKWDIKKQGDCTKILASGVATGISKFKTQTQDSEKEL